MGTFPVHGCGVRDDPVSRLLNRVLDIAEAIERAVHATVSEGRRMRSTSSDPSAYGAFGDGFESARQLVKHLQAGQRLAPISTTVHLDHGEQAFAQASVQCARYFSLPDASSTHSTFVGLGSVTALAVTAAGSAAWNAHRRRKAERNAAPQWRRVGQVDVTLTTQRMLMMQDMSWESIWFRQIRQVNPVLDQLDVDVLVDGAPAIKLHGPPVPFISVMLVYLVYGEFLVHPTLGGPQG